MKGSIQKSQNVLLRGEKNCPWERRNPLGFIGCDQNSQGESWVWSKLRTGPTKRHTQDSAKLRPENSTPKSSHF